MSASRRGLRARIWDPLRELFPGDALGGVVLIVSAMLALAWANSPWAATYFDLLHTPLSIGLGSFELSLTVLDWINDLLMAFFFLVVGLEIKREILVGELQHPKRAILPVAGALGGMIVPAAIYALLNQEGPGARGWGIPMATDIAFSLGVLALLGPRVPRGLTVFLVALAIADDLGAVAVIAIFYTDRVHPTPFAIAVAIFAGLCLLSWLGVKKLWIYLVVAPFLWLAMHASGVHATIAGVLLGFAVPIGRGGDPEIADSPLESLEHALKPWVQWFIMPLFALANAGVALGGLGISTLAAPVAAGVWLGLWIGKPIGIFGASYLAVRLGLARLPRESTWGLLWGVGMIAGIGHTVALFVASLSFHPGDGLDDLAKIGVLTGSLASGVFGTLFLGYRLSRSRAAEPAKDAPG